MFSFNSGRRIPKLTEVHHFWSFDPKGKLVIEFLTSLKKITPSLDDTAIEIIQLPPSGPAENVSLEHASTDRFMDGNNDRLLDFNFPPLNDLQGVKESKGLPPNFVGNFCLNRIFTDPWEDADLTHALTGLDYLTNLECTRRTALREVAQRLRINEETWQSVLADNSEAAEWVRRILKMEGEIDICYSSLWLDLRVWTMIKELLVEPFYKPNVIAMLNTLFPPAIKELPSRRIIIGEIYQHRNCFYRYIDAIAVDGKPTLGRFVGRVNRSGTGHTWSDVRQGLQDYVTQANTMIKQASQVHDISFFKKLPGEHPASRSNQLRGTESSQQGPASISGKSTKLKHDDLKLMSTKSDGKLETEDTSSVNSSIMSKESPSSPDSRYTLPPTSRISGKGTNQRINSPDDIDRLFQDSLQPPWYSSPRRRSSASGYSLETSHSSGRRHSSSFSRPLTPSVEKQKAHRRSVSANKRISYEFYNALPATPELPSPQANEKQGVPGNPATYQIKIPSRGDTFAETRHEPEHLAITKKKSGFNIFRRKKKLDRLTESRSTVTVLHGEGFGVDSFQNPKVSEVGNDQPFDRPFVAERAMLKKKSSLRFLQRKSNEDFRVVSDSNSDRTVTGTTSQTVKPKRSLTNLFVNKGGLRSGLGISTIESNGDAVNTASTISGLRHTLRKARSYGSVRSSSSTYSNEGTKNSPSAGASAASEDDRVITSADIDEPFPFGNFVQPQTPAMLFEDPEERQDNEDIRTTLLEKARKARMAKWEQSEESKRKLEASQQKRRVMREEMDANMQSSRNAGQKHREEDDKRKARQIVPKVAHQNPDPRVQSSEKPPKTPMKERVLRLLADSYSPTSPVLT